jgi:hypothetical protein
VKGAEVAGDGADQCEACRAGGGADRREASMDGFFTARGCHGRGEIGRGRAPPPASMGGGGGAPLGPPPWSRWRSSAGGWQARRRAPVEAEGGGLDDDARRWTRPEAAGDGVGEGRVVQLPTGVGLGLNG